MFVYIQKGRCDVITLRVSRVLFVIAASIFCNHTLVQYLDLLWWCSLLVGFAWNAFLVHKIKHSILVYYSYTLMLITGSPTIRWNILPRRAIENMYSWSYLQLRNMKAVTKSQHTILSHKSEFTLINQLSSTSNDYQLITTCVSHADDVSIAWNCLGKCIR